MPDDRQLRNELEKVQGEVLRLKKALASPGELGAVQKTRIESLRRAKQQQEEKLKDARADLVLLQSQLEALRKDNERLQSELNQVLSTERRLVDTTVRRLDPGPSRAGCMTLMVVLVMGLLGWLA
ncbi:MAG: hypothetical protein JNK82_36595 [Myxococcaceae bacterium]|nr:hypothetical protein [Myxococcaceae bacterium]